MKIALCLEYPIALRGGVSVLVESLLEEFVRRGHEIVLVSADAPDALRGTPVERLVSEHFYWNRLKPTLRASQTLARQLAGAGVQLAHLHLGGNYGWGNRFPFRCPVYHLDRAGIPCVTSVHLVVNLLDGFCGPQKPDWFKWLMLPLAWTGKMHQLAHTRREIAVSRHDLEKLQRWYRPLQKRFTQIYHSRLPETPAPSKNAGREPVILNVGHLAWRKGQHILAEAFARVAPRHPEWILQLVGEDLDKKTGKQILETAAAAGIAGRVQILGERRDAIELMRRAAIYVQPSFEEALGLALQEAMFYGCACIGSRAGGIPELIDDDRAGRLFDRGDVGKLARLLEELMENPGLRQELGRAAATSVRKRNMTATGMVNRHLELYEQIVGKH